MKKISKYSGGFTLVELMVVVAIIALLTGIVMANLTGSRSRARDAKRISDMGQIQLALQLVFDRCRAYPLARSNVISTDKVCTSNGSDIYITTFISNVPKPSSEAGQADYYYITNSDNSDYILKAVLENYNEALKDGLSSNAPASTPTWYTSSPSTCDNAPTTGREYCLSPK